MNVTFDKSADAMYVALKKGNVHKTVENGMVLMDVDKKGDVIGIEILNCSKIFAGTHKKKVSAKSEKVFS